MSKRKRKSPRHTFLFTLLIPDSPARTFGIPVKVRRGTRTVDLTLTADDVRRSIALKGNGNNQTCSMAVCTRRHRDAFGHHVDGTVDWNNRSAYVVSKVKDGAPVECVAYIHYDNVAHLNDTNQKALLKELEAHGDRIIRLYPPSKPKDRPGRARGQNNGTRKSRPVHVGAKLRYSIAHPGMVEMSGS